MSIRMIQEGSAEKLDIGEEDVVMGGTGYLCT